MTNARFDYRHGHLMTPLENEILSWMIPKWCWLRTISHRERIWYAISSCIKLNICSPLCLFFFFFCFWRGRILQGDRIDRHSTSRGKECHSSSCQFFKSLKWLSHATHHSTGIPSFLAPDGFYVKDCNQDIPLSWISYTFRNIYWV